MINRFESEKAPENGNATIELLVDWFLQKENMSHKKIQKLCYYSQAWSITLDDMDIISGIEFEAWVHGPVNTEIWNMCKDFGWRKIGIRNKFRESSKKDIKEGFSERQIRILELVWDTYGQYDADQLEILTHNEYPWKKAREGFRKFEPSHVKIDRESMKEYYMNLYDN